MVPHLQGEQGVSRCCGEALAAPVKPFSLSHLWSVPSGAGTSLGCGRRAAAEERPFSELGESKCLFCRGLELCRGAPGGRASPAPLPAVPSAATRGRQSPGAPGRLFPGELESWPAKRWDKLRR